MHILCLAYSQCSIPFFPFTLMKITMTLVISDDYQQSLFFLFTYNLVLRWSSSFSWSAIIAFISIRKINLLGMHQVKRIWRIHWEWMDVSCNKSNSPSQRLEMITWPISPCLLVDHLLCHLCLSLKLPCPPLCRSELDTINLPPSWHRVYSRLPWHNSFLVFSHLSEITFLVFFVAFFPSARLFFLRKYSWFTMLC